MSVKKMYACCGLLRWLVDFGRVRYVVSSARFSVAFNARMSILAFVV